MHATDRVIYISAFYYKKLAPVSVGKIAWSFSWLFQSLWPSDSIWCHRIGSWVNWVRWLLIAWQHQALTWTNVGVIWHSPTSSPIGSAHNIMTSTYKMILIIPLLRMLLNLPKANGLNYPESVCKMMCCQGISKTANIKYTPPYTHMYIIKCIPAVMGCNTPKSHQTTMNNIYASTTAS